MQVYPAIATYLQEAEKGIDSIPAERKEILDRLTAYVKQKTGEGKKTQLIFICTHNSRRSHTAQLWAAAAAAYYGIKDVVTYSGGTEVTAFNGSAVKALVDAGFKIEVEKEGDNPVYAVRFSGDAPAIHSFSKKYMDAPNPTADFAAVMTCSHADEACPFVAGAEARISTPYDDPKASDGTPQQAEVYAKRCKNIATELLYVFSRVKKD